MKKTIFAIFAVLCLLLASSACSDSAANPAENADQSLHDSVAVASVCFEGSVVQYPFYDSEKVFPSPAKGALISIQATDGKTPFTAGAVIEDDGKFVFDGVPAGKYKLTVSKDKYFYCSEIHIDSTTSPFVAEISYIPTEDNNVNILYPGWNAGYDLNGDGDTDAIEYAVEYNDYGFPTTCALYINGKDFTPIIGDIDSPGKCYAVIDIDTSDPLLHIAINDYGPSDDYYARIFEYDGNNLKPIGGTEGVFEQPYSGFGTLYCCGDGSIISYTRLGVFQTWHAYERYVLTSEGLKADARDFYYVMDSYGARLTTLAEVEVLVLSEETSEWESMTLPAGTPLHITKTDNRSWIGGTLDDTRQYRKYRIMLDEESAGYNVLSHGKATRAMTLFSGLCYAD